MPCPSRPRRRRGPAALVALLLAIGLSLLPCALAQDPAGVFDDEAKATPAASEDTPGGRQAVSDRDTIGFTQENAAAQMAELEERMFRLSEALRSLEPENASRLRLALKFSREELILEQMKESHALLKDAQLSEAETEVRQLLAKLEHLRNLLLAEDLDFQLKLARLRQMRETAGQLQRIVREENRVLGWSRFAVEQRRAIDRLATRKPDLESLVRDQEAVLSDTRAALEAQIGEAAADVDGLPGRETAIRNAANALAADPVFAGLQPALLRRADAELGDAAARLQAEELDAAIVAEQTALVTLEEELARLDERAARSAEAIGEGEFRRLEEDQGRNRGATDALAAASSRLGDTGVGLQKDLILASAAMQAAEEDLGAIRAEAAAEDQSAALEALLRAGEGLAQDLELLLVQLRTELQAQLIAKLVEMHETQLAIRETTEAQAPRVAQGSRTALIALAGLSNREGGMAEASEQLVLVVEETEFGIALPTTLRVLSREMRLVAGRLKDGDASEGTVDLERRIEEDLLALLQVIRRLPPTTPPPPGTPLPSDLRARERELNRLVAELKMVRLLQTRLNDDTTRVDGNRPGSPDLPADLRRAIEELEAGQEEIYDALARIAERIETPEGQPE